MEVGEIKPGMRVRIARDQRRLGGPKHPGRTGIVVRQMELGADTEEDQQQGGYWYVDLDATERATATQELFPGKELEEYMPQEQPAKKSTKRRGIRPYKDHVPKTRGASGAAGPALEGEWIPADTLVALPLDRVRPDPKQPRRRFDQVALAEFSKDIQRRGVQQPIRVKPDTEKGPGYYLIVFGERRWRASVMIQAATIPALLYVPPQDSDEPELDTLLDQVAENDQREPLTAIERARVIWRMADEFGLKSREIEARFSDRGMPLSATRVRQLKRLQGLQEWALRLIDDGWLDVAHGEKLLELSGEGQDAWEHMRHKLEARQESGEKPPSVRQIQWEIVDSLITAGGHMRLEEDDLLADCGACERRRNLARDDGHTTVILCPDRGCYKRQMDVHVRQTIAEKTVSRQTAAQQDIEQASTTDESGDVQAERERMLSEDSYHGHWARAVRRGETFIAADAAERLGKPCATCEHGTREDWAGGEYGPGHGYACPKDEYDRCRRTVEQPTDKPAANAPTQVADGVTLAIQYRPLESAPFDTDANCAGCAYRAPAEAPMADWLHGKPSCTRHSCWDALARTAEEERRAAIQGEIDIAGQVLDTALDFLASASRTYLRTQLQQHPDALRALVGALGVDLDAEGRAWVEGQA